MIYTLTYIQCAYMHLYPALQQLSALPFTFILMNSLYIAVTYMHGENTFLQ